MVLMYSEPAATEAMSASDRARAIAGRVLDFHVTAVEIRPIHDSFGMGGT